METNLKRQAIPFAQVPNELLYHPNISFKAKGIWAYMSAKPHDWQFSADRIAKETKEDRKAILSGLKELSEYGYITYKKLGSGRAEYTLNWQMSNAKSKSEDVNPQASKPTVKDERAHKQEESLIRRPKRADYSSEDEYEKAFYKWNSM